MPSLVRLLKDVDVQAISLVSEGANGQRIFLYKCDGWDCSIPQLPEARIVKAEPDGEDWSAFYIVVAEPGREEKPGLYGDPTTVDVWESEDEIRKAAWRFMRNGALVNKMHEDMQPFGRVVENAIAHADFQVGTETVRKGSWYVAIEPTEEGRAKIASGEFKGVSIQGNGTRVEKTHAGEMRGGPIENLIQHYMGMAHPFTACVRDNRKRFGPRTEEVCAGLKDLAMGTHTWRAQFQKSWEDAGLSDADAAEALAVLQSSPGTVEAMEKEGLLDRIARVVLGKDAEIGECECGCSELEVDPDAPEDAEVDLAKAKLTTAGRKQLPKSAFVFPAKAPGPGSYPIHDRAHAANALARSSGKPEAGAVKSAVCNRFRDLPACQSGAMAKGLSEDGGTVGTDMDLAERVEQIEKTVNGLGEKLDAFTAEDGPLVKGIQDLKVRFEEKASEDEKRADEKTDEKTEAPTAAEIEKKLDDVAEGQETLAKALLDINDQVEKLADRGGSRQVDQVEPVAKSNAHPLAGLFN